MSRLAARVLTGTTLAVVAAGLLWLSTRLPGGLLALIVVAVLAPVSAWELDRMGSFRGQGFGAPLVLSALALVLFEGAQVCASHPRTESPFLRLAWDYGICAATVSCVALVMSIAVRPRTPQHARWSAPLLAVWLLPPLFSVVLVDEAFGVVGLTVFVVLAKIGDNAGFFVGRAIGKRHPFPKISPGKTVAGCVASLVAGIVGGALILPFTLGERTPAQFALGALVGGLINVAAQASDLSESWVKRRAGVKDSSALLGPSGGVLDVIDSLFFAGPAALLLWTWVYYAPPLHSR
ncbi:MAG: hypothetical protein EXS08_01915 [Planctomycetes bacterium]|nr:hypothetical protein [Planctomycetota bacterium]